MIDTIVLRLHALENYESLIDFILTDRRGMSNGFAVDDSVVTPLRFQYLHFTETNHSRLSYKTYLKIPSSNYDVMVSYIQFKGYIEFSLSVPKYLYGTNVLMFTKHRSEPYLVNMNDENDLQKSFDYTFKMLGNFIRQFFVENFPENCQPNFHHLEIKRIDLCFNQVFHTQRDAKMYLMYQKMIKKKGARELSESKHTYEVLFFV